MDTSSLDTLLAEYATRLKSPPSRISRADLDQFEVELGIRLPPDHRDLALR